MKTNIRLSIRAVLGFVVGAGGFLSIATSAPAAQRQRAPISVRFTKVDGCWTYSGRFDGFLLHAKMGEHFLIAAAADAKSNQNGQNGHAVTGRDIVVSQGNEVVGSEEKIGIGGLFNIPSDGDYHITLGPAAAYGLPSVLIVCRAP